VILDSRDFGLVADGVTDDGPAIQHLLDKANSIAAETPVTLRFPENRRIYAVQAGSRHLFRLDGLQDFTIEGNGSVFLLHPDLRLMFASNCTGLEVTGLSVETWPSPTVEAVVMGKNHDGSALTVRLNEPHRMSELAGPTRQDGEQDFFGMMWFKDKYTDYTFHYYISGFEAVDGERNPEGSLIRVNGRNPMPAEYRERVSAGRTRISLPVAGIAHRHGPGAMIIIDRCHDVLFEDVEVWSAPWFAYQIFRNSGELVFRRAHIRPRPGSGRITSTWRDGFHVKGNPGALLFEDCILEGMNDDAFNVSTHTWRVSRIIGPERFEIQQRFPLQFMPPGVGGSLQATSADGQLRLGQARIVKVSGAPEGTAVYHPGEGERHPRAPELEVVVESPIQGLAVGSVVWDKTNANPTVTIRNCRIRNSCRFQSAVTLEYCDVAAFIWFYGNELEGPMPSGSIVRHNILKRGRGNPRLALSILGELHTDPRAACRIVPQTRREFPLVDILLEGNRIHGGMTIDRVHGLTLRGNVFPDGLEDTVITDCQATMAAGNSPKLSIP
jgi:hypothetical protein